jgi:hypothetical protein
MLEKLAGNGLWKIAGNWFGFPQGKRTGSFPQGMWKGKVFFCGKLGGKCGKSGSCVCLILWR